ncbi:MAG: hypothetical protein J5I93_21630 [Pirellulaceae bacterium]|nr:hypothetical protein [Pirellulaceae bacterium]
MRQQWDILAVFFLAFLLAAGCSTGPSRLARCQTEIEQLRERLAQEQQLRLTKEAQMRRLAERLAESEKQLALQIDARQLDDSLAERPAVSFDRSGLPALSGGALPGNSEGESATAAGWRPSRRP